MYTIRRWWMIQPSVSASAPLERKRDWKVRPYKKNVVFPLTRPTLNFSPDPKNFIDPLKKKINLFQKYRTHQIWAVLHVYRGSLDTGNKAFVQFNENSHNCV
jgi:hypothetical protein